MLTTVGLLFLGSATAHAQPLLRDVLDASRLTPARDSFVVMLQGQPRGWQRLGRTKLAAGWEFEDAVTINGMVAQSSRITMSAALAEQSLRQEGDMGGTPMRITLDFAQGRVKGVASTPTHPAGPVAIDTVVAAGVVDDNALLSLLVAVPWRDGATVTAPYVTSGKGTIEQAALRVVSAESITVPAGTFDTWQVEMRMGQSRTLVSLTRQAPYRIVRIQLGPRFEMQLVK
jgi:hypothetical protein